MNKYAVPVSKERRKEIKELFKQFDEIKEKASLSQKDFFKGLLKYFNWNKDLSNRQFEVAKSIIKSIKINETVGI
jgi:hypothetical protein